jgi:hypothetical protein
MFPTYRYHHPRLKRLEKVFIFLFCSFSVDAIAFESQNIRCGIEKHNVDGGKPFVELRMNFLCGLKSWMLGAREGERMKIRERKGNSERKGNFE